MCLSIFVIALPTSVIGSNFMAEWQLYHQALLQKKMRKDGKKEEYVMKTEKQKNREKIAQLEEKNLIYLQTVGEIQQKLTDVR